MRRFDTPEPIAVVFDLCVGNVRMTATDRTDTVVDIRATNSAGDADIAVADLANVDFADRQLRVTASKSWRHWVPLGGRESIDVLIEVPSGSWVRGSAGVGTLRCAGRIDECRYRVGSGSAQIDESGPATITAGAGDVAIGHALGDVTVRTNGMIRIGTVDGNVAIKNSNGDTSIRDVTGDVRVNAAHGNVMVARARGRVQAKTANGDVRLDSTERGTVVAETARGNVAIGVRAGVAAWLDVNTALGTVRNDLEAAGSPESGATTVDVRARTALGDITIRHALAAATE